MEPFFSLYQVRQQKISESYYYCRSWAYRRQPNLFSRKTLKMTAPKIEAIYLSQICEICQSNPLLCYLVVWRYSFAEKYQLFKMWQRFWIYDKGCWFDIFSGHCAWYSDGLLLPIKYPFQNLDLFNLSDKVRIVQELISF